MKFKTDGNFDVKTWSWFKFSPVTKSVKKKREKRRKKGVQRSVKIARFGQCF
jgi:hypothetical protein